jgi:hypothetical protein
MTYKIDLSDYLFLAPQPPKDLIRVGGANDGGYVTSKSIIIDSSCLLSIGISYDISFEYDFVKLSSVTKPVYMYDKTTQPYSLKYIISRILSSIKFVSPKPMLAYIRFLFKLNYLLNSNSLLSKKNVSNTSGIKEITISQILSNIPFKEGIFLKIDIEGNEYEILPDIIKHVASFSSVVIEFHNVGVYFEIITDFLNDLSSSGLLLDHLHVNNYGGSSETGLPNVLELSFSRSVSRKSPVIELPYPNLDSPNSPFRPDYKITFKKIT